MGLWYKPWFYQYVETFLERGRGEWVEYVPTLHFHQRHNKPCFWLAHIWLPWADHWLARYIDRLHTILTCDCISDCWPAGYFP